MRAIAMNAATVALALCLAISIFGEQCIQRPKPFYNCANGPTGVLFPHPQDCTVVIVCVGTFDVAVTLCDDQNYLNAYDPGHAIGCREKCSEDFEEPCNETSITESSFTKYPSTEPSSYRPEHNESSSTEPCSMNSTQNEFSTTESASIQPEHNESSSTEPSSMNPTQNEFSTTESASIQPEHNESSSTEPSNENTSTIIWSEKPSTSPATGVSSHTDCIASGVFKHPTDCTKAFFCPSAGAHPIEVDVCSESKRDPSFLKGCNGDCTF